MSYFNENDWGYVDDEFDDEEIQVYLAGTDILGADDVSTRGLLIRIRDVAGLVRAQGGATGALAQSIVPDTIESTIFDRMRSEMAKKLKEQGVNADVSVVTPAGFQPAGGNPIWKSLAIGFGATTLGSLAWMFFKWRKGRR